MRTSLLLPLSLVLAGTLGCADEEKLEVAALTPARDLTLPVQVPKVEVVSAVELEQPRAKPKSPRRSAAPATVSRSVPQARSSTTADSYVPNDRELLPGKTVTMIPASSGPSVTVEPTIELPARRAHWGIRGTRGRGKCPLGRIIGRGFHLH